MSDAVKWALLIAIMVTAIGIVLALPLIGELDLTAFTTAMSDFAGVLAGWIKGAKSLALYFVPDSAKAALNALIVFDVIGWISIFVINITLRLYHWVFK